MLQPGIFGNFKEVLEGWAAGPQLFELEALGAGEQQFEFDRADARALRLT